jgi:hypothetical protein
MYRRAAVVSMFLISAIMAPAAHATGVTTYGVGLDSCKRYLDARQEAGAEQVAFVDWLSGYFSGVNRTSTHRNNFFGLSDLKGAMAWLDNYCSARPQIHFAEAVGGLVLNGKPGPAAHAIEDVNYGSADKSCAVYIEAREQRDAIYRGASSEFTTWLGGYVSGVNAISLRTNNVLGNTELSDAVSWLERYCGAHPQASFSKAVETLVLEQQPRYASQSGSPAPR